MERDTKIYDQQRGRDATSFRASSASSFPVMRIS